MKKALLVVAGCLVVLLLAAFGVVDSWTFTPHGRLDLMVAISLKLTPEWPAPGSISVEQEREELRQMVETFSDDPIPMQRVVNRTIPRPEGEIPIRIYQPVPGDNLPILVYFHGGAFRMGDLDTHDGICRALALGASAVVVSVDYRLAPEHPFPAGVEDCYAATEWVFSNAADIGGESTRIAVGGDSAGGNLAAVTALKARDLGGPRLVFQLLVYPVTDLSSYDTDSWRNLGTDYFPTREMSLFTRELYIPHRADRTRLWASPLLASDHSNLPKALVITAQFDPLRDEGQAYVTKLRSAGVEARHIRYDGVLHGFFGIPIFRKGQQALNQAAAALEEAFSQ